MDFCSFIKKIKRHLAIFFIMVVVCMSACENKSVIEESDQNIVQSEKKEKITINMVGDTVLSKRLESIYNKNNISEIVSEKYINYFKEADYNIGNLECVITDDLTDVYDKKYTFSVAVASAKFFKDLGFDLFSLANNHSMDYGRIGLKSTFDTLDSINIDYVGAGETREKAREPHIEEIGGHKIAIIGVTQVVPSEDWVAAYDKSGVCNTYDGTNLKDIIDKAKKEAEKVIIFIHWGKELEPFANKVQKATAHRLVDYGVDLIVGAHPHILQEVEYYKNVPIVYSLGNFIYGMTERETVLLNVNIDYTNNNRGDIVLKIVPGISSYKKVTDYWGGEKYNNCLNVMRNISTTSVITDEGIVERKK